MFLYNLFHRKCNVSSAKCYEELGTCEPSTQRELIADRVRRWLDETPDVRTKDDLMISTNRGAFLNNNSSTSYLEEWEDASLFEALRSRNRFSGLFCCFQGIFQKTVRMDIKTEDDLEKRRMSSEDDWDMQDIYMMDIET